LSLSRAQAQESGSNRFRSVLPGAAIVGRKFHLVFGSYLENVENRADLSRTWKKSGSAFAEASAR
jgi:hypothetical protein